MTQLEPVQGTSGSRADMYEQKKALWKRRVSVQGIDSETEKSVLDVLRNGPWYTGGEQTESLEKEIAEHFQTKYALSCATGTAAWHLTLMAYDIGQGDEVILPANGFMSIVCAIAHVNAKPVLVDVEDETYNLDLAKVQKIITPRTKVILLPHIGGHPVDIDPFIELGRRKNIKIVGDTARALGSKYKGKPVCSLPDITFASIGSKSIGSGGLGGIAMTNDEELVEKMRLMRGYGKESWSGGQEYSYFGLNYEMSEIGAAIARHQLRKLNGWQELRRSHAKLTNEILERVQHVQVPVEKPWAYSVYTTYFLKVLQKRDELVQHLRQNGVRGEGRFNGPGHYPFIHMQKPVQDRFGYKEGQFPVLEDQAKKIVALDVGPTRTREEITQVAELIRDFCSR
ncbi:MAG TPA: DegT/DnrJ/EryC1/StrS family aminotransferase [Candidatus Bathyarchaeia archaeon]|nr:DegT/DnrJ/EryC1/StrS family aminotransferase [Candidatus Bathyarchaeia archaeon]